MTKPKEVPEGWEDLMTQVKEATEEYIRGQGNGQPGRSAARTLRLRPIGEVLAELAAAPARTWLAQGLWPAGAYGVLGAQDKAGKTWVVCDLAISVASGGCWFGRFACEAGPVAMFLGEGGMAGIVRRLRAVCEHKGVELAGLPLHLEFKAPNLTRPEHLDTIAEQLDAIRPRLVVLDPLYLAVGGKNGSSLSEMGDVLSGIQAVCEHVDAALVVVSHWTKNGDGRGPERFTGVGPSAWGRVLGSAAVEQAHTSPDGRTDVTLAWTFKGGEIPDQEFRIRRSVWVDDPQDLNSPMHYEVQVTTEGPGTAGTTADLGPARRRILAALHQGGALQSVHQVQDATAGDGQGRPLTLKTVRNTLPELERIGLAEGTDTIAGMDRRWSITAAGKAAIGVTDGDA